eukprot:2753160-Pyramimonas_sp.AAC.1
MGFAARPPGGRGSRAALHGRGAGARGPVPRDLGPVRDLRGQRGHPGHRRGEVPGPALPQPGGKGKLGHPPRLRPALPCK